MALCYKEGLNDQEGHLVVISNSPGLLERGFINARFLLAPAAVAQKGSA